MAISLSFFGISLAAFSLSLWAPMSILLIVAVGFGMVSVLVAGNTVIQTLVDEDKRSRVMSFYVVSLTGTAPIGSLVAGTVASFIGARVTLAIGGAVCLLIGLVLLKRGDLLWSLAEPIYREKGLI
jgi:MFS family permease